MNDEYTDLERLAKEALDPIPEKRKPAIRNFTYLCSPEIILKLVQKARVQTQLVEALRIVGRELADGNVCWCEERGWDCETEKCHQARAALAAVKETI